MVLKFGKDVLDRKMLIIIQNPCILVNLNTSPLIIGLSKSTRRPEKFYAHNCLTGKRGGVPKQDPRSSLINEVHRFIVYSLMPDSELSKITKTVSNSWSVLENIVKSGSAFSPKE